MHPGPVQFSCLVPDLDPIFMRDFKSFLQIGWGQGSLFEASKTREIRQDMLGRSQISVMLKVTLFVVQKLLISFFPPAWDDLSGLLVQDIFLGGRSDFNVTVLIVYIHSTSFFLGLQTAIRSH